MAIGTSAALPEYFPGFLRGKGINFVDFPGNEVIGKCYLNLMSLGHNRVMSFQGNKINEQYKVTRFESY
ncbi:MAG: hypothetical protein MI740_01760 [Halanaerobiales bacterium]|nr:hypothetical protein [Halanaerobiales bacterium]